MEQGLSNDRIIAVHRNRYDYIPPDSDTLMLSYGYDRYTSMTLGLYEGSDILKVKILDELLNDFERGDSITLAILSSDIINVIFGHFENIDNKIREQSVECIRKIATVDLGRKFIIEKDRSDNIANMIDDGVESIRKFAYLCFISLVEYREGVDYLLNKHLIPKLVDKIDTEPSVNILKLLLTLINLLIGGEAGQFQILQTLSIQKFNKLLFHHELDIRVLSANCLTSISFNELGKREEIKQGCVTQLCTLMNIDKNDQVIKSVTMGLASLAQRNECKFEMVDDKHIDRVIELFNFYSNDNKQIGILLNTIQLMTGLAEYPKGRKATEQCLPKLESILKNPEFAYVKEYSAQAIQVITWTP